MRFSPILIALFIAFWLVIIEASQVSVRLQCGSGQHQVKKDVSGGYELWCAKNKR